MCNPIPYSAYYLHHAPNRTPPTFYFEIPIYSENLSLKEQMIARDVSKLLDVFERWLENYTCLKALLLR